MKKAELLQHLEAALRKGDLKDPSIITKVECASEESLQGWDGDLTKMWGGAPTWRYSQPKPKSPEQVESERQATETAQKEISEVPEHLHDHYKGMRQGRYAGVKSMPHDAAKSVLNIATYNPKDMPKAASILMDHGHTAGQARKVLGEIDESNRRKK